MVSRPADRPDRRLQHAARHPVSRRARHGGARTSSAGDRATPRRSPHDLLGGRRGPFQVVAPEGRFDFEQRDLTESRPRAAARQLSTTSSRCRSISSRAAHARPADEADESEHVLELVFDHIICDGWSHVVIFDELGRLYDAFRRGEAATARAATGAVRGTALRRERARLSDDVIEQTLELLAQRLAGIPTALELPTDQAAAARVPRIAVRSAPTFRKSRPKRSEPSRAPKERRSSQRCSPCLRRPAVPLQQRGDDRRRHDVGGARPAGVERERRPFREHRRVAGRPRRRPYISARCSARPAASARGGRPPGRAVRASRRRPRSRSVTPSRHPIFQAFFAHVRRYRSAGDRGRRALRREPEQVALRSDPLGRRGPTDSTLVWDTARSLRRSDDRAARAAVPAAARRRGRGPDRRSP